MPFELMCENGTFKPIEAINVLYDKIATVNNNTNNIQYDFIVSLLICPTRFYKASYANMASLYSQITTTYNSTINTDTYITTITNGHATEKQMAREFIQKFKPKSDNYYDTVIDNGSFSIPNNDYNKASEIQKIATHAGYVAEMVEEPDHTYTINVLGDEQILGMTITGYSTGNGNLAANITVDNTNKIIIRTKTNNVYKIYIL